MEEHRGRFQAQGDDVPKEDVSVPWGPDGPPTQAEGDAMLDELRGRCTKRQRELRDKGCFQRAREWIKRGPYTVGVTGPAPISKHCYPWKRDDRVKNARVDIEITAGTAWIRGADES